MWEFMVEYANDFWKAGEYSWEVFTVVMAWSITLGIAITIIKIIWAIGSLIAYEIKERRKE